MDVEEGMRRRWLGRDILNPRFRGCVGKDLANQALFMDIATILWAFNIEKAQTSQGELVTPSSDDILDEGVLA